MLSREGLFSSSRSTRVQKLKGTFTAEPFEQTAKRLMPYFNPKIARQKARLHRLKRAGKAPPLTKQEARKLCDQAAATHPITKLPPGTPP